MLRLSDPRPEIRAAAAPMLDRLKLAGKLYEVTRRSGDNRKPSGKVSEPARRIGGTSIA
ncbi:MAG: hypothetical protein GW892_13485 [Armatimonadetes bacterium]|nr:hypothetical protein [Armatimonadota bacterium]